MRIVGGITGSGDRLTECVTFMEQLTKKYKSRSRAGLMG